jgi:transcriptional regulator with XRE-family HTH domain
MNNQIEENYGARIKELRIQMGLTQNQVAEELNVTPGYISNVENNRTAMSLRILTYYAKLVGISLDSLVGQVEQEYQVTALDNDLMLKISKMSTDKKLKLLKTFELWEDK